jgi:cytochrome c biogenesis protein CcmG/thiol:disulfide interchange protein DsbE
MLSAVVALGLTALLAYGLIARAPDTRIDDNLARNSALPAPSYRLPVLRHGDLGGRLQSRLAPALADGFVAPAELVGTPYALNFWASWCVPCQEEASTLERAWRQQARPRGVLFLGLDMQDVTNDARNFMRHYAIDYPNIRDPTNGVAHSYGATGVPETFFIGANGKIVGHVIGASSTAQLTAGIEAALAGRVQHVLHGGEQRPLQ